MRIQPLSSPIGPPLARRPYRFGGCTHPLSMPRKRGLSSGWSRQERGQVNLTTTLRLTRRTVLFSKCLMITNSPITPDHILQANKYDVNPALCILSGKYGEKPSRFGGRITIKVTGI